MNLLNELKRRKVLQVAAVYASAVFAIVEAVDVGIAALGVPESALRLVTILGIAGFPLAIGLAWVFDVDRSGIRAAAPSRSEEGRAELEAAAKASLLDPRTMLITGALVVFGLGLGAGWVLNPTSPGPATDEGPALAVLPFENRSLQDDGIFFVDGIHDELLNQLSKIGAIRVIARSSVMGYRDEPKPLQLVADDLGVQTVLQGGVQRSADQVRVSVQLVDAATGTQLWAESYEETLSPVRLFAIQRDVSQKIAAALEAELTPGEATALAAVPTLSQEAYDAYLRGKTDYFADDFTAAEQHLDEAVRIDPSFAAAWARLSATHSAMYQFFLDRTDRRLELARIAGEEAVTLAPDLAAAHVSMGQYHYIAFRDYPSALASLDRAAALSPSGYDGTLLRAAILRRMGQPVASTEAFAHAVSLDPLGVNAVSNLGVSLGVARVYEASRRQYLRALELTPEWPQYGIAIASITLWRDGDLESYRVGLDSLITWDDPQGFLTLARWRSAYLDRSVARADAVLDAWGTDVLEYQTYYYPTGLLRGLARLAGGDPDSARPHFEQAVRMLEQALQRAPDDPRLLAALGQARAGLSDTTGALQAAEAAVAAIPIDRDALDGPVFVLELAKTHAMLGDLDGAADALVIYLGNSGEWSLPGLLTIPPFEALAGSPRLSELEAASLDWAERVQVLSVR